MASVPISGQFYAKIVSQKMDLTESQNEGGHSTAKNEVTMAVSNGFPNTATSFIARCLPLARFMNVSACSAEKLPVDLDKDLK